MVNIYLAGAGPGDPDLLTLKTARLLADARVVLHDSLVGAGVLALINRAAERIDVGKRCGGRATAQAEICRLLVEKAKAGGVVVRLKGGDPSIFGRVTEEMAALRAAGMSFEIVPGVTAASAAAAALPASLTRRGVARSLHFITGCDADHSLPAYDWAALARAGGTLAFYMGRKHIGGIAARLRAAGMEASLPAAAIESASLAEQRTIRAPLSRLAEEVMRAAPVGPVLLLVGEALAE